MSKASSDTASVGKASVGRDGKYWISDWNPEDPKFWAERGKPIARRNLIWSILAENVGFSVWLVWSVVATRLPKAGFPYTTEQLFQLVAVPGLVGALARIPYTLAVPKFGGRNWTIVSALLLSIPTLSMIVLVRDPSTPFWLMLLSAASAGLGGGNFASSMANISFFFPDREKGFALGLNAAGGNIGVSTVQLLVPIVVGYALLPGGTSKIHLENAGLMWLPLILLAVLGATFFMNNLTTARSNVKDQVVVTQERHTWIIAWLYIGTFGSFVGYSAAFPLLLKTQFPEVTTNLAFLGALVGSVARPLGGKIADRLGGARVTFWNFVGMAVASLGLLWSLETHNLSAFLVVFLMLFMTTGIGNGSTFRMIPVIFRTLHLRRARGRGEEAEAAAFVAARRETAAVIGIASATGALGGYFIPRAFGASIQATGGASGAVRYFLAFYVTCVGLTWWCYLRSSFLVRRVPSLAEAGA
ncbi:MAG TPA: NarK family nitrate/nitrite MFS transporter [Polyangiaceae bacterium]|nr:NarK family nitrate/nitrite MFS transporter [Polyangiaceae bacterium]